MPAGQESIDAILAIQIAVSWAGESGEDERRLGWWRSDMVSRYGGHDLLQRLTPLTWRWAALESAREAARRVDARVRASGAEPDLQVSLFRLGFDCDEALQDRLRFHKMSGKAPVEALPDLQFIDKPWDRLAFADWLARSEAARVSVVPAGRRLVGPMPDDPLVAARRLAHALVPLDDVYPCPHFRDSRESS